MLLDDIKHVKKQEMKMVGYTVKASLNEDSQMGIVEKLREKLLTYSALIKGKVDESVYLIQVYEEQEWTPEVPFTHIVAVEVQDFHNIPDEMINHTIPKGNFILFKHQGPESEIDATYHSIDEWLNKNCFDTPRVFDMEQWLNIETLKEEYNVIHIYVPL